MTSRSFLWLLGMTVFNAVLMVQDADAADLDTDLDCLIEPYMVVNVSSPVDGLLETVSVERGDLVKKGQILATLDSTMERAVVAIARARTEMKAVMDGDRERLEYNQRKLERAEEMFKEELVSDSDLDEAKTEKLLAEKRFHETAENKQLAVLELKRAEAALSMRTVQSPISGVVVERFRSAGEFADRNPILKLAQIDPLHVEVFIPVSRFGEIKVGIRAQVLPESPVSGKYLARVTVVDRVVDAASGTFGVRLELPNPKNRLPAGLKCKILFLHE